MHKVKTLKYLRPSGRSGRPSSNPYLLDDITPTLAEVRNARSNLPSDVR